ncbi:MAG: DegT/DnrJ/EryC1/StrS family aminotransferase [Nitrospirae bacterium]|nr:DegT/DnrJ/EryC1/StrS family aminotransferase [Nitrospirota bacterium]
MKPALLGGTPVRTKPYPVHITTGQEEKAAALRVIESGILSDFEGSNNQWFLGGAEVKAFEKEWSSFFGVKYGVSVNSATSGLMAAVGAAGVGPGDEVITVPWTMTATAAAILVNNAVPIFCDIEPDTFCMSPASLESRITSRTKAVIPVHIYGHPAEMDAIMQIAERHSLIVIEDASQSPGMRYKGRLTGTIGHMGVFSLNCHKIIQTGEGGVITTNDDELALKLQLIRNHAEAVIATGMPVKNLINMIGWNYRLNEIEAAIGREQLKKLSDLLRQRRELADYVTQGLKRFDGLITPAIKEGCEHSFYRYPLRLDPMKIKVSAPRIVEALNAEGMDFYAGYLPLNEFPIYQQQVGFGEKGCPFKCPWYGGSPDYSLDLLPNVAHAMNWSLSTEIIRPPLVFEDMDEIIQAFDKVWNNLSLLS